jgi:hypothetical protein
MGLLSSEEVEPGLRQLAADLASGEWARRNSELLDRTEMDYGYRLIVAGRSE